MLKTCDLKGSVFAYSKALVFFYLRVSWFCFLVLSYIFCMIVPCVGQPQGLYFIGVEVKF